MEEELPLGDEVYVLKEGRRLGPFTVEDLLDGLESGDFSEDDLCLRAGASDCERLRDLLDWEEEEDDCDEEEDNAIPCDPEEEEDYEGEEECEFEDEEPLEPPTAPRPPRRAPHPLSSPSSDRLLYAGHPSALSGPFALLALVGGVTGGIWLYRIDPAFALVGFGFAMGGLARIGLLRLTHDYRIRSRRIELSTGFLARSSREVRIADVRSINVDCRGLAGILGVGTVEFFTAGDEPEITFHQIWAARRVKALVRRLQDLN